MHDDHPPKEHPMPILTAASFALFGLLVLTGVLMPLIAAARWDGRAAQGV